MSFISERFDVYIKPSLSRRMYIKCVPHNEQTSYCTEYKETMLRTALYGAQGIFLLDVRCEKRACKADKCAHSAADLTYAFISLMAA